MGCKYLISFVFLFVFIVDDVSAQSNRFLDKEVSVRVVNQPLSNVLKSIEKQTGVVFSYTAKEVNDQQIVNLDVKKATLEKVLDILFKNNDHIKFTVINHHVVLSVKEKQNVNEEPEIIPEQVNSPPRTIEVVRTEYIIDTVHHTRYIYDTLVMMDTLIQVDTLVKVDSVQVYPFDHLNDSLFLTFSIMYNQVFQNTSFTSSGSSELSMAEQMNLANKDGVFNYGARATIDFHYKNALFSTGLGYLKLGEDYMYQEMTSSGGFFDVDTLDIYYTVQGTDTLWYPILDSTYIDYKEWKMDVTVPNTYTYFEIPVSAGYEKTIGRVQLAATGGLAFGFLLNANGKTIHPSIANQPMTISKNLVAGVLVWSELNARLDYALTKQLFVSTGLSYKRNLTSFYKQDYPLKKNINLLNYHVGLAIRL